MFYRRILYLGQFAAAIVLPTWVLVSRGLLDDGIGWELLVYLVACPILSVAMLAASGIIAARGSARTSRTVSWLDAALLSSWYLAIVAYGLWASPLLGLLVVVLGVGTFWAALWQLFTETRARFQGLVADFEQAAHGIPGATSTGFGAPPQASPEVIVINPTPGNDGR